MDTFIKPLAALATLLLFSASVAEARTQGEQDKSASPQPVQTSQNATLETSVLDQTFTSKSGEEYLYSISIPADYDPDTPKPLIVALHYGGEVTPHYARGVIEKLVGPGLNGLGAIIIAPDSIGDYWGEALNESMVLQLMDYICQTYNIDQQKILLTGFSMGGYGTWFLGSRHQDRFSAMIPVAGQPHVENDVAWTTPIYAINSRADTIVAIEPTEEYVATQKAQGNKQIILVAVDGLTHHQTASFTVPLNNAVPWVNSIWKRKSID